MKKSFLLIVFFFFAIVQLNAQSITIPAEIIEVRSFGSWDTDELSGHYRIVIKAFGSEHVVNMVFIQWIGYSEKRRFVVESEPISKINKLGVYVAGIEQIENEKIIVRVKNSYVDQEFKLHISVGLPGEFKVKEL